MKWHTDTPDWSDSAFDDLIADALHSTVVTPRQKRLAWQRLQTQVVEQTALPPLADAPPYPLPVAQPRTVSVLRRVWGLVALVVEWWLSLLLDDTRYDRALRQRNHRLNMTLMSSPLRNMLGGVAT